MQFIIDTFAMIWSCIQFAFDYLMQTVKNVLNLLKYLKVIQGIYEEVMLNLPGWVQPFILLTVTVSIVYILLGTNTGGKGNS